ncbi:MAG: hypothetical protein AABX16_02205 [Nanoarchaeota archaeon]
MVTKLESYRCGVCSGIFIGSYEDALVHEEIPIDTPLPKGLVLLMSPFHLERYGIIYDQALRTGGLIDQNKYAHDYLQTVIEFYPNSDGGLEEDQEITQSSRYIKECLRKKEYELLSVEFPRFVSRYDHCSRFYTRVLFPSMLINVNENVEYIVRELDATK